MDIDRYFFTAINGYAKKSNILDALAVFFAEYAGYFLIILLLLFSIAASRWQVFVIPLLSALFARFIANEILYALYKRPRPPDTLSAKLLIKKPAYPGFPSGHASFFFALSFALLFFNVPLATAYIATSLLICFCRVFCGVHWPSDIAGGALIAGLSVFIVQKVLPGQF